MHIEEPLVPVPAGWPEGTRKNMQTLRPQVSNKRHDTDVLKADQDAQRRDLKHFDAANQPRERYPRFGGGPRAGH